MRYFNYKILFCVGSILINITKLDSQSLPGLDFEKLTSDNGLSSDYVNTIFQDSKGFLWIGTVGGLNRYDGYTIKTYFEDKSTPNSLSSNVVACAAEDNSGNLWFGNRPNGLDMFDPGTEKFYNYRHNPEDSTSLTGSIVDGLFVSSKNKLWVACRNGLNVADLNKTNGKLEFTRFQHDPSKPNSIASSAISWIIEDTTDNSIWISTNSGWFSANNEVIQQIIYKDNEYIFNTISSGRNLMFNRENEMCYIRNNNLIKLVKKNNQYEEILYRIIIPSTRQGQYFGDIRTILFDSKNRLWILTSTNGVYLGNINNQNSTVDLTSHSAHDIYNQAGISSNLTSGGGIIDRSNVLWIGTIDAGLNKYNIEKKQFIHVRRGTHEGDLPFSSVRSVCEDDNGNIWVGSQGDGLALLPSNTVAGSYNNFIYITGGSEKYSITGDGGIIPSGAGFSIYDIKGAEYPGTFFDNTTSVLYLDKIDLENNTINFKNYRHNTVGHRTTLDIASDRFGSVWYAEYANGLHEITLTETGEVDTLFIYKFDENDSSSISDDIVRSIAETQDGTLWVGTRKGLCKTKRDNGDDHDLKFFTYTNSPDDTTSLSNDYILPLHVSADGTLWIGTLGGGLNRYVPDEDGGPGHFISYTTKNGLPNNIVKGILDDDRGFLWVSTSGGLAKFDPETEKFLNFDKSDGIQGNDFGDLAAHRCMDGRMIFGGTNGLTIFYPDEIKKNPFVPGVVISGLSINNHVTKIGQKFNNNVVLPKAIHELDEITVSYRERVLELEFTAIHYAQPSKNKYRYKLEGFDEEWIETVGEKRYATYADLKGGSYTFKVKAANLDGEWNEEPVSLVINVIPPFWKTGWFIILLAIVLIGIAVYFYRRRVNKLKDEQELLQAKIDEGLNELNQSKEEIEKSKKEVEEHKEQIRLKDLQEVEMRYFNQGLANFSEIIGQYNEATSLCQAVITELVEYVEAQLGVIYIISEDKTEPVLNVMGTYGGDLNDPEKLIAKVGEGYVGTCFKLQEIIELDDVPQDYIKISSGLGELTPGYIIFVPLVQNENKLGVIEVASFNKIEKYKVEFIQKLGENITSTILLMRVIGNNREILEETQMQAEELKSQEEEMRQNMEEMRATQENLGRLKEEEDEKTVQLAKQLEQKNAALKKIEKKLKAEEFNLTAILTSAEEQIYFKDLEGKYTRCSKALVNSLKLKDESEIIGKSDLAFFEKEFAETIQDIEQKAIASAKPIINISEEKHKNGASSRMYLSIHPTFNRQGRVNGIWGIRVQLQ